ncbi:hypothetical protein IRT45_17475 [Nocardia sp. BSTN01]|nr:hypothetical protein [Nocardia sp. BSTN01]MBF4998939.1 hypothetical protein [Nocardia sp. BSTN01]
MSIDSDGRLGEPVRPDPPGGASSLILLSDNNFGATGTTAFHLLAGDGMR